MHKILTILSKISQVSNQINSWINKMLHPEPDVREQRTWREIPYTYEYYGIKKSLPIFIWYGSIIAIVILVLKKIF